MCVQYWPPNREKEEIYGDVHITVQSEEELANFHIRTFRLFKVNKDNVSALDGDVQMSVVLSRAIIVSIPAPRVCHPFPTPRSPC